MKLKPDHATLTRTLFCILVLVALSYCTGLLFVHSPVSFFQHYLYFVVNSGRSPFITEKGTLMVQVLYNVARTISVLLLLLSAIRTYKYYTGRKAYLFLKKEHAFFQKISVHLSANLYFFRGLPSTIKWSLFVLLCAQLVLSFYLVFTIPFFYDEAWSYMYFSGRGLIATMGYYPAPNNHVFFNVIGSVFSIFPFDPVLILRLPVVGWGLLSTWYFFKFSDRLFSQTTALLTTILFACSFPCICYNSMGRGYGMLIFFSVLTLYSAACILLSKGRNNYLFLFAAASVGGFYTIPSFLYCYLPVAFALFLYYLIARRVEMRQFIFSQVGAGVITVALYLPIIALNGLRALTENNGVIKRDLAYIRAHATEHFVNTWNWLAGTSMIPLSCLIVFTLLLLLRSVFIKEIGKRLLLLLFVMMIFSPIVFLYAQRTIPFERTWSFLIIPIIGGIGVFMEDIYSLAKARLSAGKSLPVIIPFSVCCVLYASHLVNVKKQMQITDYWADMYLQLIKERTDNIKTIGFTEEDINFYLAEDIQFETIRNTGRFDAKLLILKPGDVPTQDVIVLKKNGKDVDYMLNDYEPVVADEPVWTLYIKKDAGSHTPASR